MIEAHERNDHSAGTLAGYRQRLDVSWVMKDLKTFRNAPKMLHIDRIYNDYPELVCNLMDHIYRIDGTPKDGLVHRGFGRRGRGSAREPSARCVDHVEVDLAARVRANRRARGRAL